MRGRKLLIYSVVSLLVAIAVSIDLSQVRGLMFSIFSRCGFVGFCSIDFDVWDIIYWISGLCGTVVCFCGWCKLFASQIGCNSVRMPLC